MWVYVISHSRKSKEKNIIIVINRFDFKAIEQQKNLMHNELAKEMDIVQNYYKKSKQTHSNRRKFN